MISRVFALLLHIFIIIWFSRKKHTSCIISLALELSSIIITTVGLLFGVSNVIRIFTFVQILYIFVNRKHK